MDSIKEFLAENASIVYLQLPDFTSMLFDNHGRIINYLRLAVTDRCNLRCTYCMPIQGIKYVDRTDLLTYEEIDRIVRLFAKLGISKIRITGGEPFVRKGMMECIARINDVPGINSIHLTTNGTLTETLIPDFKRVGIKSVNLSLDSLDRTRFQHITRRDDFDKVMTTLDKLLSYEITTKINMVVMQGKNIEDIRLMVDMTKELPISVRFLEEMPFNGNGKHQEMDLWNHKTILDHLKDHYPTIHPIPNPPNSTSINYQIPGHQGTVGIIASYSRLFCGTCNRIRLTPTGLLKTCLYDGGVFNIRDLIRSGASDEQLTTSLLSALDNRAKDGKEAELKRAENAIKESMATIGG